VKDFILGLAIVAAVTVATTETLGLTNYLGGEQPAVPAIVDVVVDEVEDAASDIADGVPVPNLPSITLPSLPGQQAAATVEPTSSPTADGQTRYISHTGGTGVRVRDECRDDAGGAGALPEGQSVVVIERGTAGCGGWTLVVASDLRSWVRNEYLDASPVAAGGGR
jgi:hypothetical protein